MQLRRQGRSAWATPRAGWGMGGGGGAGGECAPPRPAAQNQREQEVRCLERTLPWKSALGMATVREFTPSLT